MKSILGASLMFGAAVACVPGLALAGVITVLPGGSIQAAVDAAAPGDTVKVMPGDYMETHNNSVAVRITKPLKLIGKGTKNALVRLLQNPAKPLQIDGILVEPADGIGPDVDGVKIRGFTVEGFKGNGIWLRHVDNFRIERNVSANNEHNGIFPTLSANGLVKKNVSYGALDSGLWVEASENVRVIKNEVYNNPTGLEVTVSKNLQIVGNIVHDNTVGIGLYHPNGASLDPLGGDGDWLISRNRVYDNNFPNPVSGGLVGALPPGIGVLVIGVDRVTLDRNEITGNSLHGITLTDWCAFNDCMSDPPIVEDKADDNSFIGNTVSNNGSGSIDPDFIGAEADFFSLATGVGNCATGNAIGNFVGIPLPPC